MWSPWLVSAKLQTGKKKHEALHILPYYAPTRKASRAEKDIFDDLQHVLRSRPPQDLLGDFNTWVGSREDAGDVWGNHVWPTWN